MTQVIDTFRMVTCRWNGTQLMAGGGMSTTFLYTRDLDFSFTTVTRQGGHQYTWITKT